MSMPVAITVIVATIGIVAHLPLLRSRVLRVAFTLAVVAVWLCMAATYVSAQTCKPPTIEQPSPLRLFAPECSDLQARQVACWSTLSTEYAESRLRVDWAVAYALCSDALQAVRKEGLVTRYGLASALMLAESGYNPKADNRTGSAIGLWQIKRYWTTTFPRQDRLYAGAVALEYWLRWGDSTADGIAHYNDGYDVKPDGAAFGRHVVRVADEARGIREGWL